MNEPATHDRDRGAGSRARPPRRNGEMRDRRGAGGVVDIDDRKSFDRVKWVRRRFAQGERDVEVAVTTEAWRRTAGRRSSLR